jgi:hypothetical protein
MSGSNSSARDAVAAEPVSLTVHSVAAPDVDGARRTRLGRLKMLAVLAVCASPVIASYLAYFVFKPEGRTNYGALILPTRPMPALPLTTLDGQPLAAASLKNQWLLVAVGPAGCDAACEKRLYMQRQLREMLGRERDRLDKVWFVVDAAQPKAELRAALEASPAMTIARVDRAALAAWLQPAEGRALEDHLYIVDPHGDWMMRAPADADPQKVKRDLDKLMRGSSGWDQPGR